MSFYKLKNIPKFRLKKKFGKLVFNLHFRILISGSFFLIPKKVLFSAF